MRYVYNGNEKVAMLRTDSTTGVESAYYFINDANGTPLMILDPVGAAVSRINMDDWGNLNKMRIGSRMEINYTGKKMDTVTGLYYFNQRYYDPEIGRFIQEDLAQEYTNPYVYVGNNVANLVDPDGLMTFAELNGCSGCGGTSVRRGFDFNDPSYIGGGDGGSISMENGGGFPSISFGSSSIVINRANARPLPTVVLAPMSAGEKGAAINNLAAIISSARSGMVDATVRGLDIIFNRDSYNYAPGTEQEAIQKKWVKCSTGESLLHKIGGPDAWQNSKYVSPSGHGEAVYNKGQLVRSGINRGTYNIYPKERAAKHFVFDMVPWFAYPW